MRYRIIVAVCYALAGGAAHAVACNSSEVRTEVRLTGEVSAGERFAAAAGPSLTFVLEPDDFGWTIGVLDRQGGEISWITPPFHFVPNTRQLHGWHFRNRANTGPNIGDVNAPQRLREFIFDQEDLAGWPLDQRVAAAEGWGTFEIMDFTLSAPQPGRRASFTALEFEVCLSWPTSWSGSGR